MNKDKIEKPLTAKERKIVDHASTKMLADMMNEFMTTYEGASLGFDVSKLRDRIEEAQNKPRGYKAVGRPSNNKINLIELFLAKAHFPDIATKALAKYFDVHEQNLKLAIRKYNLDTKHTLERVKGIVTRFAALPIREEFRSSVNLHLETENEIKIINLTLTTLRDPTTGLLFREKLTDINSEYYIKALKEAEMKKIKLLAVITNMRSKVLQYFEYDQFINEVLHIVTEHAGVKSAQIITHKLENFMDVHGFGTALPAEAQKLLPANKP